MKRNKLALILLCLFSFTPQMIMWCAVIGPDHFAVLEIVLFVVLYQKYIDQREGDKKGIFLNLIGMAVSAAFINWFKPLSVLYVLIFACTEVLQAFHMFLRNG